jgi:hypothetical protein
MRRANGPSGAAGPGSPSGVASWTGLESSERFAARADQALHVARVAGRDRVVAADLGPSRSAAPPSTRRTPVASPETPAEERLS